MLTFIITALLQREFPLMKIQTTTLIAALMLVGCASAPADTDSTAQDPVRAELPAQKFDARLTGFPYPFDVAVRAFEAQGQKLEMAYMDKAPENPNGQVVLLLHGKNFSGAYWERTAKDLLAKGYRVVIPDQIGFGKSSKPTEYSYSLKAMAEQTADLLQDLGVAKVHVVGHSMGGMVAARFALDHAALTQTLTLVNPIGLEDWQEKVPPATVEQLYAGELKKTGEDVKNYMKNVYFDGKWEPDYDAVSELQVGWTTSPDRETLAMVGALTSEMVFTQPVVHEFPKIAVPTLLIIGTRDRTAIGRDRVSPEVRDTLGRYDELGQKTRDAIPGSELVEIPNVGHMPQIEAYPQYIEALTGFLERF